MTDKDPRKQGVHCCYIWTSIFEMSMYEKLMNELNF